MKVLGWIMDDVSSTTTSTENQQAPPARTAFSVIMSTSVATKLPQLKNTNAECFKLLAAVSV